MSNPPADLYAMAALYVVAGLLHFVWPRPYRAMMPPYLPAPNRLVALSGLAEVLLGVGLLIPATQPWAAWGVILLLIAVFPANVYMATAKKFSRLPAWLRWGRLPLQALLIAWAYQYT